MPPGSAKSTYAAIIAASHTAELAERWGRRTRNLIAEHSSILGYGLAQSSSKTRYLCSPILLDARRTEPYYPCVRV